MQGVRSLDQFLHPLVNLGRVWVDETFERFDHGNQACRHLRLPVFDDITVVVFGFEEAGVIGLALSNVRGDPPVIIYRLRYVL